MANENGNDKIGNVGLYRNENDSYISFNIHHVENVSIGKWKHFNNDVAGIEFWARNIEIIDEHGNNVCIRIFSDKKPHKTGGV